MRRPRALARTTTAVAATLLLLPAALRAHTREKNRINEVEAALTERTALLTQGVKDALEATTRQEEALRERQQHADFLQGRIDDLRQDVDAGLKRVVDSIGTTVAPTLQTLEEGLRSHVETRLDSRIGELALAQSRSRDEALAPVATRLNALEAGATTSAEARQGLKQELETLRTSLGEFRTYLESFTTTVDTRLADLTEQVRALGTRADAAEAQRKATDQRLSAMLQAIDQENRQVRRALRQLAGDDSPAPSETYVVQKGDSLYAIARRHSIPLDKLEAANPKLAKSGIHPGDQVVLPAP